MDIFDFKKIKAFFDPEKITSNKKLLVYVFFVGIATIFWFLNALSKEYTTNVNYPVRYVNLPKSKVLTNELPSRLTLKVTAFGFDLLRYKLSTAFLSNPFDVNKYTNNRLENESIKKYHLLTSQITNRFEKELSSSIRLQSISPDTIVFELSPILEKKVPIQLNISNAFEQQYMLGGEISLSQDSVVVKGPSSILDTIFKVETELLVLSDLDKTVKKNVDLKEKKGIEFLQKKIEVTVPVEQFTEAKKTVLIRANNLPDSLVIRLFPRDVKVSYFVGLKRYDNVSADHFDFVVDYKQTLSTESNRLAISLIGKPTFVSNVRFYPQDVTYLIEKKKSIK
ncbi:YbbR-like domain-containing protein [Labilibaculum sp. DW002]|uniref:YbbR-like domain-containing protein n=1 Tax=Paralabilibaculum antarcticum TaxID=2912572 RepID=A0ABT5VYA7_9BACT|nr:YbbR-like domain-containing protein [Labilibaculum sp. DW002]MDE5420255.1 YbbR-like domain-containing protein [Labilibaculum sp. DW002]